MIKEIGAPNRAFVKIRKNFIGLNTYGNNTTAAATLCYNLNSLHLFDGASDLSAPFLSEYSTMYTRYRIRGVAYEFRVESSGAQALKACAVAHNSAVWASPATTPTNISQTVWDQLCSQQYAKIKYIQAGQTVPCVLKGFWNFKNVVGNRLMFDVSSTFVGNTGGGSLSISAPSDVIPCYFAIGTGDGISTVNGERAQLQVTYYIEFFERAAVTT